MRVDALELNESGTIAQEEGSSRRCRRPMCSGEGVDTGLQTADLIAEDSDDLTALLYLLLDGAQGLLLIARITGAAAGASCPRLRWSEGAAYAPARGAGGS